MGSGKWDFVVQRHGQTLNGGAGGLLAFIGFCRWMVVGGVHNSFIHSVAIGGDDGSGSDSSSINNGSVHRTLSLRAMSLACSADG